MNIICNTPTVTAWLLSRLQTKFNFLKKCFISADNVLKFFFLNENHLLFPHSCVPEFAWPCLTQVAKVWWKFLFCWNVTVAGDPTLVVSTILVPVVTEPLRGATITFCAGEMVLVVLFVGEVVEAEITVGFCCSNRF